MSVERRRFVGVDLGQSHDPTAVAVLDRVIGIGSVPDAATWEPLRSVHYELRFLERVKLGTPYPEVVARVRTIADKLGGRPELVVDGTGVGRPVVDMLRGGAFELIPVQITGGSRVSEAGGWWHVPKRDLVADLVVLFQRGELRIAGSLADAGALVNELTNFRVKLSAGGMAGGNESYGNWRDADHDDLVLAVALAVWRARWTLPREMHGARPLLSF